MARTLVALILVMAMVLVANAQHPCPANQEWNNCGSACPPSCNSQSNQACTLQCIIGCQCKPGFLLNNSGHCVQPQDC